MNLWINLALFQYQPCKKFMQYAFNVDIDLSRMWESAPIETLFKVHYISFTDRLVFTTRRITSLKLDLCLTVHH
jgi:hypothetical protein